MGFARMDDASPNSQKQLLAVNIDFIHQVNREKYVEPASALCCSVLLCDLCGLNCGF